MASKNRKRLDGEYRESAICRFVRLNPGCNKACLKRHLKTLEGWEGKPITIIIRKALRQGCIVGSMVDGEWELYVNQEYYK